MTLFWLLNWIWGFAIIQTLIIVFFSIYLLNINLAGSLTYVILINILLAIAALVMGIFISTFANSEFQMVQFIPIVAIPGILFWNFPTRKYVTVVK